MPAARRLAGLVVAVIGPVLAGCSAGKPAPEPDPSAPAAPAPPADTPPDPTPAPAPRVEPPAPRPGEIALPAGGGTWPWVLAPAPASRPFRPVAVPNVTDVVTGLAVRPAADRAAVTVRVARKPAGAGDDTRVVWCDTAAGKVLAEWEEKGRWVPCDVSPDGRRALVRSGPTLAVWTVAEGGAVERAAWEPHGVPGVGVDGAIVATTADGPRHVAWAAFVGGRVVSSSAAGQLRVFDAETRVQVGTIDAAPGRPTLTPDGSKVLFLTTAGVALLDPAAGTVVGVRPVGPAPQPAALAVSPGAATLAVGGHDRVALLDLATGTTREGVFPKDRTDRPRVPEAFGWAGEKFLLADTFLYRPDVPVPVWDYGGVAAARCLGRQTWVVVKWFDKVATVRPFELPETGVEARVAAAVARPGVFVLRPGDGVRVDVSGLPEGRQEQVRADLERRLREVGYRPDPDPDAGAAVYATLDPAAEAVKTYDGYDPVGYTRQPARVKLVKGALTLWEQAAAVDPPPRYSVLAAKKSVEEFVRGHGGPDWGLFARAAIPPVVYGRGKPLFAFGSSELHPTGIVDRE